MASKIELSGGYLNITSEKGLERFEELVDSGELWEFMSSLFNSSVSPNNIPSAMGEESLKKILDGQALLEEKIIAMQSKIDSGTVVTNSTTTTTNTNTNTPPTTVPKPKRRTKKKVPVDMTFDLESGFEEMASIMREIGHK